MQISTRQSDLTDEGRLCIVSPDGRPYHFHSLAPCGNDDDSDGSDDGDDRSCRRTFMQIKSTKEMIYVVTSAIRKLPSPSGLSYEVKAGRRFISAILRHCGLIPEITEHIVSFLEVPSAEKSTPSVIAWSSTASSSAPSSYTFRPEAMLKPGTDDCFISAPGSMPNGRGSEWCLFDMGQTVQINRVRMSIPKLPAGPLSVRRFRLVGTNHLPADALPAAPQVSGSQIAANDELPGRDPEMDSDSDCSSEEEEDYDLEGDANGYYDDDEVEGGRGEYSRHISRRNGSEGDNYDSVTTDSMPYHADSPRIESAEFVTLDTDDRMEWHVYPPIEARYVRAVFLENAAAGLSPRGVFDSVGLWSLELL